MQTMTKLVLTVAIGLCFSSLAHAQRTPPAPCGPKADLAGELGNNVAADSRCFEIRMYTVNRDGEGTDGFDIDMLHQRFREEEIAIFEKHGAEFLGAFQSLENPDTLIWMLAYRDRAHRQEVWAGFLGDPAWTALLCSAPGFLDSGLTVFASMLPRPARRSHVAPERGFDSGTSLASTARCTSA